jgi:hypothetical protein
MFMDDELLIQPTDCFGTPEATAAEIIAGLLTGKFASPKGLADAGITPGGTSLVVATGAEVITGTNNTKYVSPKAVTDSDIMKSPAGSIDGNVALFDGASGKLLKDSGLTLSGTNTGDDALNSTSLHLDQTSAQTISNGMPILAPLNASELVATTAAKKLQSLDVATYPSLAEIAYIKGLTGAIQSQINGKQATLVSNGNIKTVGGTTVLGSGDIPVSNIVWKGTYNALTDYIINDGVSFNGSSYICKLASTGNLPTDTTYWDVLASMGNPGVSGISGSLTTPFTSQTTVAVAHNFNAYPAVQVINDSWAVIIPLSITHNSANQFTVVFTGSTSGNIVATIGGVSTAVTSKSGDYSILVTDNLILTTAALTLTLPAVTGIQGKIYQIKNMAANGVPVTVITTGGKTIDGQSSVTIIAQYTTLSVFTDGSNWFII